MSLGNSLQNSNVDGLDYEELISGIRDTMENRETRLTPQQAQQTIEEYFTKIQQTKFKKNIEEGQNFLEQNKKRAEVHTLPSGLQYEVINQGLGQKPKSTDRVKVHYEGRLLNGKVFDSSYRRGEPAVFGVTQVIKGWVEALQLMNVGSKWKLYIPSELAYGEHGAGRDIEPHATLIFDVELLGIE